MSEKFKYTEYLDKIVNFSNKESIEEISNICKELSMNQNHQYLIFIDTGGFDYVIDRIASDIFLSLKEIDEISRNKLALLSIVNNTIIDFSNIFGINNSLINLKEDNWLKEKEEERRARTLSKIKEKVKLLYSKE
jgi:hypothetical protein